MQQTLAANPKHVKKTEAVQFSVKVSRFLPLPPGGAKSPGEGADFELQNDVMHHLVASAVHGTQDIHAQQNQSDPAV